MTKVDGGLFVNWFQIIQTCCERNLYSFAPNTNIMKHEVLSKTKFYAIALVLGVSMQLVSCGGEQKREDAPETDTTAMVEAPKEPAYAYKYTVEEVEMAPRWALVIGDSTDLAGFGTFIGKNLPTVGKGIDAKKIEQTGPFSIAYNFSKDKKFYAVTGIFVNDSTIKVKSPRKLEKIYAGKALKVVYLGDYNKIEPAYMDIEQYMKEKGLRATGNMAMEQYMNDPMVEKDTAKWETHIYYPVEAAE